MDRHLDELMPPIPYEDVAPAALLRPPATSVVPGAASHLGLIYAQVMGWRPLRLDVHLPTATTTRAPAVIYVHGGSFIGGIPAMGPWTSLPLHGIAVVSVSYRLTGEVSFPEPVEDVRAAVRWVRDHADEWGIDPGRLALWGSSAGALLSGIAAVSDDRPLGRRVGSSQASSHVSAAIGHYGVSDLRSLAQDAIPGSETQATELGAIMDRFVGSSTVPPSVTSHLGLAKSVPPPFLLVHGDADQRVGPGQSRRLHDGLVAAGGTSTYLEIPGADHGTQEFFRDPVVGRCVQFLRQAWDAPTMVT
ncbi:alpha/beta hydrolase [Aeromicrobium endophyticum]|uniref:Alpha/beta hydrolase n=1 Tax=Aeromicrobium endophyticum TaxID=2292704 RepID=A0A371PAY0_9ACTN|nr:alpha/beta hydrolase [Aeromicrobium endophyticum]REK73079.1 alpha/beta hydrolase [Aeromicrobium endophyticum]